MCAAAFVQALTPVKTFAPASVAAPAAGATEALNRFEFTANKFVGASRTELVSTITARPAAGRLLVGNCACNAETQRRRDAKKTRRKIAFLLCVFAPLR